MAVTNYKITNEHHEFASQVLTKMFYPNERLSTNIDFKDHTKIYEWPKSIVYIFLWPLGCIFLYNLLFLLQILLISKLLSHLEVEITKREMSVVAFSNYVNTIKNK